MRQIFGGGEGGGYVDIRQRLWVCNTIEAGKNTPGHFGPEGVVFLQSSVFAKRKISRFAQHDTLYILEAEQEKKSFSPLSRSTIYLFFHLAIYSAAQKILALLCDKQTPIPPYTPPNPPRSLLPPQRLKKKNLARNPRHEQQLTAPSPSPPLSTQPHQAPPQKNPPSTAK